MKEIKYYCTSRRLYDKEEHKFITLSTLKVYIMEDVKFIIHNGNADVTAAIIARLLVIYATPKMTPIFRDFVQQLKPTHIKPMENLRL